MSNNNKDIENILDSMFRNPSTGKSRAAEEAEAFLKSINKGIEKAEKTNQHGAKNHAERIGIAEAEKARKNIEALKKQMENDGLTPKNKIKEVKNYQAVDIKTLVYPGFPTDLQQVMATFLTQCNGKSTIEETIYENRFQNLPGLGKMGASYKISADNKKAIITGKTKLTGTDVDATDLRGGASLLVGALIADGTTTIDNIAYILRGYDTIAEKLTKVGAKIEII